LCFLPLVDYLYLGWYYPCLVIFLLWYGVFVIDQQGSFYSR
jgi:hypothetical protein